MAGDTPPIYFGFGSMPVKSQADTIAMISAACAQLGFRPLAGCWLIGDGESQTGEDSFGYESDCGATDTELVQAPPIPLASSEIPPAVHTATTIFRQ